MVVFFILLIISVFFYANAPETMDKTFMSWDFALMVCSLTYFIYYSIRNSAQSLARVHFRHSIFFIICYVIVFFQRDLDYLVGVIDDDITEYHNLWYDTTVVAKSMALSTMGLISVFCGYSLLAFGYNRKKETVRYIFRKFLLESEIDSLNRSDVKKKGEISEEGKSHDKDSQILNIDLLIYFCFVLLGIYLVFVDKSFIFGGYATNADKSGPESVIINMMQSSVIAIFAVYSYNYRKVCIGDKIGFLQYFTKPLFLLTLYTSIILISGARGAAVRMVVLFLMVYLYANREYVNYKFLYTFGIAFVLIFSFVGLFRTDFADSSIDAGIEGMENMQSISPVTCELANSVNTLHIAMSYFPKVFNYTYGITFFIGFGLLVPFLDSFLHAHVSYYLPLDSAFIITNLGLGRDDLYGMGSSCVADVYIAMGPLGVFIIFLLLGLFLRYLEVGTFVKSASPFFLVLSFGCYTMFPYVCRGTLPVMFLSWSYATIQTAIFTLPIRDFLKKIVKA